MRILATVLGLVLLLSVSGPVAGSVRATSIRVQLAAIPDADSVSPDPRVGPIFLPGDIWHICTGSVVHSDAGDLIVTAAHCLGQRLHDNLRSRLRRQGRTVQHLDN